MTESAKKINRVPESYSPKNKPEILNMMEDARQIEKLTQTLTYKGVEFELVQRTDVIWVGCVDYADNNTDESDISTTLKRFQGLVEPTPIKEKINPDWSAALSINYTCNDKPSGIMFANESYTDKQDKRYDIYTQPGGLWLRVKGDDKNARALLDKEKADLHEYFAALRNAAKENGYIQNPDVHVEVEYHCHAEYNTPPHTCYAYIPIIKSPEYYSPKDKPEILTIAEAVVKLPEYIKIPFTGAIDQEGPALGPHTRAFASAVTSLAVLLGAPHDTSVMTAHNRLWRNDNDYYRYLMVSGEGFLFWHDVLDFFTDALPQFSNASNAAAETHYNGGNWEASYNGTNDAAPILDCFEIAGIKAELYSNYPSKGVKSGWSDTQTLEDMTLCNLARGFPVLLFSGEPGDRIILATGYENNGESLLAWTFTAGDRIKTNTKFSPAKCKRVKDWTENILVALLIKSSFTPPKDIKPLLTKALARGAEMLRLDTNPDRFRDTFYGTGKPHLTPEIWDLAERRCYLADALVRTAEVFGTDKLTAAIEAGRQIHDNMWKVYAIWKEKKTKMAKKQIADILDESRQLDLKIADTITSFLTNQEGESK